MHAFFKNEESWKWHTNANTWKRNGVNILQIPLSSEITIIWILKSKLTKLSSLTNIVVKNNKQTTCIIINVLKKAQLKGFANRGTQIVEGEDNISRSKTNISSNRHGANIQYYLWSRQGHHGKPQLANNAKGRFVQYSPYC